MNTLRYFDFGAARPVLLLIARIAVVLIFIIFGFPKMMGFDGTVQYMASLGAPMPMLAAIIAVVMEVPAAILIVLGFFISFIKRRVGNKDEITRCRWRRFHDDGITFLRLLDAGLTIPSGKTIVHPLARQRRVLVKIQFLR